MNNYFRITAQSIDKDNCFIADSYGHFEKLWQFSAYLIEKGFKIIAVSAEGKFEFGNIPKAEPDPAHIIIRACAKGKAVIEGNKIKVYDKVYKWIELINHT